MSVRIAHAPFDIAAEIAALTAGPAAAETGAVASFTGRVRATAHGRALIAMTLEHYPGMTEAELTRIEADAVQRFQLSATTIIHRVGRLTPGEDIVLVIASAAHRQSAFDGCAYLMDYLKTKAPFWKKEEFADGETAWVDAREADDAALARWGG